MERTENTQHSQLHQCPEGFHTIHTPRVWFRPEPVNNGKCIYIVSE
ncbi:hypothetical protein ACFX1X_043618 [Malus domestica]